MEVGHLDAPPAGSGLHLDLGIERFNEECRKSVFEYTGEWRDYVTRQARWVDFDHDYKTLDPDYMESVLWAFKTLYDKGLVYEGWRVLPYCWNDETPLSSHELRMDDDVYQQRQDQSVTVTFPLVGERAEVLGLTGVLELLQLWMPGRHARLEDFVVDALAACVGLAIAAAFDWIIRRTRQSSTSLS